MPAFRTMLLCVALLGAFGAAWLALDRALTAKEAELRAQVLAAIQARQFALAQARSERVAKPNPPDQGSELNRGGEEDAVTLTEWLARLVRNVVREALQVSVRVDRFVEFELVVELPRAAPRTELALWSRDLLRHAGPYLYSLKYLHAGTILGSIDREGIEAVAADAEDALTLLDRRLQPPSTSGPPDSPEGKTDPSVSAGTGPVNEAALPPGWLDPESARAQMIHQAVVQDIQRRAQGFFEAVRELSGVVNRLGREGPGSIEVIRGTVTRERAALADTRKFLAAPGGLLDERLREAGFGETYRRAAVRTFRRSYPAEREAERMISQAQRYADVLLALLALMEKHRIEWAVLPEVQKIQFLDPDLFEVYRDSLGKCEAQQKQLNEQIEVWRAATVDPPLRGGKPGSE